MEHVRLGALIFTVIVNVVLAAFVYKNNPRSDTNIIFGCLAAVTSVWLVDVYLSVNPHFTDHALLWVRLSIFFAAPQIFFFFMLAHTLPSQSVQLKPRRARLLLLITLLLMLDALSPLAFRGVKINGPDVQAIPGPGLPLFVLFAVTMSASAVWVLYRKLKRSHGNQREQFRYVMFGLILMLGLLISTVLIPVAIFKKSTFVPLIPLYTVVFLGLTTYAIIKQKLFDIRAAVTRSVSYLVLISLIALIFGVAIFGVVDAIFPRPNMMNQRQILTIVFVTFFVLSFQGFKRQFDKVTNRLFYRDSYDIQQVLDELGAIVVAEIDLGRILRGTSSVLAGALKSSSIEFVLFRNDKPHLEITHRHEQIENLDILITELKRARKELVLTDEITDRGSHQVFANAGIAASLCLKAHEQVVGYLLIGNKRSGDVYSGQDQRLLNIAASELAIAIQNALRFEEIENFNATLQQRVDDATRKLRRANEKLKAMDETKDDFISMASHQLRTPLTSIKGYLSMVMEGDVGKINKQQHEMLTQAFFSSQRMVYLIADLLNVSRLKTGKFVIEAAPVNLADLVEEELSQVRETAKIHNLKLTYTKPKNFPLLMLDETKIRQVVMNFVDNAIYYTPSGGGINVQLRETPSNIELRVIDEGIGVPKQERPHLFTKFYRAGNARKVRPDGTGLGLFMAKKVVIAQGGSIIFDSQEGKGSTFGFAFSKRHLAPPSDEKQTDPTGSQR